MSTDDSVFKSGYIALVGRPNVGKSTLLNALVGQKISITSSKAQTTRHQILGIKTTTDYQMIYVDTPGYHLGQSSALNKYMNKTALSALADVDVILFLVQAGRWTDEDSALLARLSEGSTPVVAVVNKIDLSKDKQALLPFLDELNKKHNFHSSLLLSAKKRDGIAELENEIASCLSPGHAYFDEEQVTDKSLRFMSAELVRESLYRMLHDELPYSLTVEIEQFTEEPKINRIRAIIWVDKASHKQMVIGKQGAMLKRVGQSSRLAMEKLFDKKVFLQLWVKVKTGWGDDERMLQSLGYKDR